jgi:eukaryotic-like serine/threonine-protein kinase
MQLAPFDLGPFRLHGIVGSGAMGRVWSGVHRARGVPVAVKVVVAPGTGTRRFTLAFRNEVRQVAKLDHPHVVKVLDHGEADEAAEAQSGGRIDAGAPWFAMEYASGGALSQHLSSPVGWPAVLDTLRALLCGLAHAHARGVLHRDLSPRNVLLAGPADPRPGVKLADFGLARGELTSDTLVDGGTPQYMSPEQFEGRTRSQGPWSDLYALGCVAWEIVTGSPPFVGRTARDLQRLHASAPVPPMVPRLDVPEGLEPWLLRLLCKAPADRYRFAADALRGLAALGSAEAVAGTTSSPATLEMSGVSAMSGVYGVSGAIEDVEPAPRLPVVVPPAQEVEPGPRHPLIGVGLGLYELRTLPLVDRHQPRDVLWTALRRAWEGRRPRAVVLRGVTGHGKTHLGRSIAWRAHEVCGAELLAVEHSPLLGPTHGLRYALASALGLVGLGPDELLAQLEGSLAEHEPDAEIRDYAKRALAGWLTGSIDLPPPEQDALAARVIGWLCRDRPLVLRLEGLQWGPDTARFARWLLTSGRPLPVLIVATVDAPGLEEPPLSASVGPEVEEVEVGPLAGEDQHTLVQELLNLEPALSERVVRRTGGSPLFAERLIGDWVRRGVLSATGAGYALSEREPALPDDLHQIWLHTVEQALRGLGGGARTALQICGALGIELDRAEWADATARAGVEGAERVVDELADALCARHLAEPRAPGRAGVSWPPTLAGAAGERGPDGWVLTHPLVWESLRRQAREAGCWEAVNRACAEMVSASPGVERQQGRLGLHRMAAGDLEGSLAPLLAGATRCVDTGDLPSAGALLDRRDEALGTLGVDPADPRWGDGRLLRVRLLVGRGAFDVACQQAQALAEAARRAGWAVLPEALRYLGLAQLKLGRLLESEAMLTLAQASAARLDGDAARQTAARCEMLRGTVLRIRGALGEALQAFEESRARFEALGDVVGVADCLSELGHAQLTLAGELDGSQALIERAKDLYEEVGSQVGVATCVNTLGDIHRRRGDLAAAEAAYRWALVRFDRSGSDARLFPRLNLGMVLLHQARSAVEGSAAVEAADELFAEAQAMIARSGRAGLLASVRICRLPGAVLRRDQAAWDEGIAALAEHGERADADLAFVCELAASLCRAAGEGERAAAAAAWGATLRLPSGATDPAG